MSLRQLLYQARNEQRAQKALYESLAAPMFLLCRRYTKTDSEAEEVMMNGFLKCFRSLPAFEYVNDAAAIGWIRRIMVNECLMHLRQMHSFVMLPAEALPEAPDNDDVLDSLSAEEIFRLITQLPLGYRTVFNLYVLEERTHKEIGELLGISEGTSKSQLSKARGMLQQLLIQNNEDYGWRKTK